MQAFQFVAAQQPPELREVPVPEPGPGQVLVKVGGAGACHSDLHLMEAPAERLPAAPLHARPRERGLGREARPRRDRVRAGRPRARLRPLGLRNAARTAGWAWRTTARTTGGLGGGRPGGTTGDGSVPARPGDALPDPAGVPRSPRGRPAHRRGADQLPRRQAVAAPARGRLDRRGDRGRRPRPDGHPDPARAQLGHDRRRRGHRGRQARDRQAHGRGRGAALR